MCTTLRRMVSTQHRYWVYILASQPRGTLYIGVTNNILGRMELHRAGKDAARAARLSPHSTQAIAKAGVDGRLRGHDEWFGGAGP